MSLLPYHKGNKTKFTNLLFPLIQSQHYKLQRIIGSTENPGCFFIFCITAQSRRSEPFGVARSACFEQLACVFASCGALHYAKILASLKMKNGISLTPLDCALNECLYSSRPPRSKNKQNSPEVSRFSRKIPVFSHTSVTFCPFHARGRSGLVQGRLYLKCQPAFSLESNYIPAIIVKSISCLSKTVERFSDSRIKVLSLLDYSAVVRFGADHSTDE